MPEHLNPPPSAARPEALRLLSRSPHPYHRRNDELADPSANYSSASNTLHHARPSPAPSSDSGTEADDEHFLKGLPAPKRSHKGLRGRNEAVSGTSTPLAEIEEDASRRSSSTKRDAAVSAHVPRNLSDDSKKKKEVIRRLTELVILGSLAIVAQAHADVHLLLRSWGREIAVAAGIILILALLYPARLILWAYYYRTPQRRLPLAVPSSFDPAPLFYPPTITVIVSLLIAVNNEAVLLPNIVLAICSLPPAIIPSTYSFDQGCNPLHWALSCAPLVLSSKLPSAISAVQTDSSPALAISPEDATLLYPIHCNLLLALHSLTTTSLLPAELELLSNALVALLFLSYSPQMTILKAMLWVGGLDILVTCSYPISWAITLARVPKWRFKRPSTPSKGTPSFLPAIMSWRRVKHDLFHAPMDSSSCSSCEAMDDPDDSDGPNARASRGLLRVKTLAMDGADGVEPQQRHDTSADGVREIPTASAEHKSSSSRLRRHTLPGSGKPNRRPHSHTPSGRRKRSASFSVRAFFSLTQRQAFIRKWAYAAFVYVCIIGAVFAPVPYIGVKEEVQHQALHGYEPVGWALGYLFGDLPWFRWEVVSRNLERWICLPSRNIEPDGHAAAAGWVDHLQTATLGEANTRLMLSAYCVLVIAIGLLVVFRLSPVYEVDTRRKVFHFMMVAMFLPATYVDPTFAALALSIILAVFLLLDLLRASQLPPLSKPLASFLAPYVDGRDLRGPVVISHIFLLIGCAIPLWLSLGSLPRAGEGALEGWKVPVRETAMVAGVVCVGLGDAAASLVGRRIGHRKWRWGGGKSLEGSLAFAVAVCAGLLAAHAWLRVGGWTPATSQTLESWPRTVQKAGGCATIASLTEAVLTGGNDNVIVPVVLWTCVKSLGI
ncbi:hypothetical protein F4780DRAFT_725344 [Xylariomycetidae sp. FL0641]|nr:hypothetical protein F4780DRAFT_725344 [Xylariomycetidae sp. FL0641]